MNMISNPLDAERVAAADRDSLHTLSLSLVPLQTPMLRRARMVKNNRLLSVLELYRDRESGSGQVDVEKLPQEFGFSSSHPDYVLLQKLELMPSYDVYSLRVLLR